MIDGISSRLLSRTLKSVSCDMTKYPSWNDVSSLTCKLCERESRPIVAIECGEFALPKRWIAGNNVNAVPRRMLFANITSPSWHGDTPVWWEAKKRAGEEKGGRKKLSPGNLPISSHFAMPVTRRENVHAISPRPHAACVSFRLSRVRPNARVS